MMKVEDLLQKNKSLEKVLERIELSLSMGKER
jgi:hypothetical protein